ncbi:50S ribosomal protein L23 [Candidatus Woesearchaeota archaeon]|nr:MAG: 50S ribosomal protein L23 [Candidatus Woesearchaeota archaeon]
MSQNQKDAGAEGSQDAAVKKKKEEARIQHPLTTEKAMRLMESENTLVFVVDKSSTKQAIKEAIEDLFSVKVAKVNTVRDAKGRKRAFVKFAPEVQAIDLATRLGMM